MVSGTKTKRFLRRLQLFVMTRLLLFMLLGGLDEPDGSLLLCHLLENRDDDLIGSNVFSFGLEIE